MSLPQMFKRIFPMASYEQLNSDDQQPIIGGELDGGEGDTVPSQRSSSVDANASEH